MPGEYDLGIDVFQLEGEVRRDDGVGHKAAAGIGRREPAVKEDVCRPELREPCAEGSDRKKTLVTAERREAVGHLKTGHEISERRACVAVELSRSVYRYEPKARSDVEIQDELLKLASEHPEYGFSKFFKIFRRCGRRWNHKRVHRVYCSMNLNKRRKHKRRLSARNPMPLAVPEAANQCWSADFMSDALWDGRRFRTFNVVDDYNREALGIEIDLSLPSQRVVRVLDRIAERRGLPARLRFDNGPEFTAVAVADWAEQNGVELEFIKPGRPKRLCRTL